MASTQLQVNSITVGDCGQIIPLLERGFPTVTSSVWQTGFERIRSAFGEDQPVGRLLSNSSCSEGVMLTIQSERQFAEQRQTFVSLSSWYISPQFRIRAPWMLSEITQDSQTTYLDLTPTPAVARLSRKLDFRAIAPDMIRINLVTQAVVNRHSCNVLNAEQTIDRIQEPLLKKALIHHNNWGFMVCGLEVNGSVSPLVFALNRKKRIVPVPGLSLIYGADHSLIFEHIGSLARFLTKRGKLYLEMDLIENVMPSVPVKRLGYNKRMCRGPYSQLGTDYLYSESVVFQFN